MAERLNRIYVGFADIIYALIIGSSFDFLKQNFIPFALKFDIFSIFLAYAAIVQSWIGYHRVIDTHSYKTSFRFVIDLVVWFLFFILIFTANNFDYHIKIYPLVFFFLMLWRYGVIRDDFVREGWKKTLRALRTVVIYVITSSIAVIIQTLITFFLPAYALISQIVVLAIMYAEIFTYYQLRKRDRIGIVLKDKPNNIQ